MTEPNTQGHRFIKTIMVPVEKVRTDPKLIENFTARHANPGPLRGAIPGNPEKVPRPVLLAIAVENVIKRKIKEAKPVLDPGTIAAINGFRCAESPPNPRGYKVRPLAGIWATAPFLHNGSVPTLYDLLLPEERRPPQFYVGGLRFDARHVGWNSTSSPNAFLFRVFDNDGQTISGNSNAGHSGKFYISEKLKTALGRITPTTNGGPSSNI